MRFFASDCIIGFADDWDFFRLRISFALRLSFISLSWYDSTSPWCWLSTFWNNHTSNKTSKSWPEKCIWHFIFHRFSKIWIFKNFSIFDWGAVHLLRHFKINIVYGPSNYDTTWCYIPIWIFGFILRLQTCKFKNWILG